MKIEIEKPVVPQWFDEWYKNVPTEQDGYDATKEEHAIQLISQVGWGNGLYESMSDFKREKDEAKVGYVLDNKMKLFYAILFGYEVEQEPRYYAKNKLTGQYLGNKDIRVGYGVPKPYWASNKLCFQVEKLSKEVFEKVYGLDDTNTDFERVE